MEGDEISVVLSRVSELRSKVTNCIDKATRRPEGYEEDEDSAGSVAEHPPSSPSIEEAESLFSIRDALESLEEVLSSFQGLKQQQRYEREATLAEIDHSRKILLKKIKEYKGEDLEVIHEVSTFASETVEHDDDLLLPPYPSHSHPMILDKGYSSNFPSTHTFARNGVVNDQIHNERKSTNELEKSQAQTEARNSRKGLRFIMGLAAKTMVTLVSVVSILSLAGFEPRVRRRRSSEFKVVDMFQKSAAEEKVHTQCPPGKVLVIQDGEPRCLVKERVEIPFEPVVTTPDVSYGCG